MIAIHAYAVQASCSLMGHGVSVSHESSKQPSEFTLGSQCGPKGI